MAIGLVKKYLANPSMKNVLMIMSGTFLSQVLPILFFPILSRLYTPADYGVLGIFMSISMLLTVISNLQLNHAILIPKENDDALSVLFSGVIIVIAFSCVVAIPSLLAADGISALFNSEHYPYWLYFLPFTILLSGINVQLTSWFIRQGNFKIITKSRVSASIVSIIVSLGIVVVSKGPFGLVVSFFASAAVNTIVLLSSFEFKSIFRLQPIGLIRSNVSKYQQFSIYTLPTELISNFAQQLPLFIFSIYSGVQSVGWFSRSRQILGIPLTYFSSSIAEVYKQKASEAFRNNPQDQRPLFLKTLRYLFLVSIFPFIVLGIFAPTIFTMAFGESWRMAGVFTQALLIMYFFKLIISPLTYNFYLYNKQKLDLTLHILMIALTSLGLFSGYYFFGNEIAAILIFSVVYATMYLIYGVISYKLITKDNR